MLASDSLSARPDVAPTKFDIDDNVGEGIHLHIRNVRIDMSIAEFDAFAEELVAAGEKLDDGRR